MRFLVNDELQTGRVHRFLKASRMAGEAVLIEEPDSVRRAVRLAREGKADFADYLIGELHLSRKCRYTVTFDRSLKSSMAFSLL